MSDTQQARIRSGRPPTRTKSENGEILSQLAEAAKATPGVWFSVENPGIPHGSVYNLLAQQVTAISAETSQRDGRIWVRFYE